jgi:lipopolysaccharide biosynthesis regulator YciM
MIACEVGKMDEASQWLLRALQVNSDEAEANLCLGDLYNRSGSLDDAKRCYDKICGAVRNPNFIFLLIWKIYPNNI